MHKFILQKGFLVIFTVITLIIIGFQFAYAEYLERNRSLHSTTCTSHGLRAIERKVFLKVRCDERELALDDAELAVKFASNSQSLTCRVHSLGVKDCVAP